MEGRSQSLYTKMFGIQKPREDQHLGDVDLMPVVKAWGQGC